MTQVENARDGLTIADAARRIGVHYQTIRLWMKKYDEGAEPPVGLPYTVFGAAEPGKRRIIRIHPQDLAAMAGRAGRPEPDTEQ